MLGLKVLSTINKLTLKYLIGIVYGQSKCILLVKKNYLLPMVMFLFSFHLFDLIC